MDSRQKELGNMMNITTGDDFNIIPILLVGIVVGIFILFSVYSSIDETNHCYLDKAHIYCNSQGMIEYKFYPSKHQFSCLTDPDGREREEKIFYYTEAEVEECG